MKARASAHEVNFDCLVGPTHHFGGLSFGNLASTKNKARLSSPKRAAMQGIAKMRYLYHRGFKQAILPPHERPHIQSLRNLGFCGDDHVIMQQAHARMPQIFSSLCSSSAMWAANAATICPSFDALDSKIHITPANLVTMLHRSIEPDFAYRVFKVIFGNAEHFVVHPPLLAHDIFSDEGAANHSRMCPEHAMRGLQIFVYGKEAGMATQKTSHFPARQSRYANDALILRHQLQDKFYLNIEQNPLAIDGGAFHNDVVAVANQNVLLCHEMAFVDQQTTLNQIRTGYQSLFDQDPVIIEISTQALPLEDAVSSYLFNSQLLSRPEGGMLLFAPTDTSINRNASAVTDYILSDNNPIEEVSFFNVSESMANGGGPACLRLRVLMGDDACDAMRGNILANDTIFDKLSAIVHRYYVDELMLDHFFDPQFLRACSDALDEISAVLGMGSIYDFQRGLL